MPVELQIADELTLADVSVTLFDDALAVVGSIEADARLAGEICVRICGAAESQQLNLAYRGQDKPTNILSFPADVEIPQQQAPLGDLAICWPVVESEAQAQGKSVAHHLTHLFVHGVFHLLGYDHETSAEAEVMEALEVDVLQQLNIPDPYNR